MKAVLSVLLKLTIVFVTIMLSWYAVIVLIILYVIYFRYSSFLSSV